MQNILKNNFQWYSNLKYYILSKITEIHYNYRNEYKISFILMLPHVIIYKQNITQNCLKFYYISVQRNQGGRDLLYD